MVRLAFGVVAGRDRGVWAAGPDGVPVDVTAPGARTGLPPGTPVVVGPRRSDHGAVVAALHDLTALIEAGGVIAAGAGVAVGPDELEDGWRTARLAGGGGDRRDAVLAALPVLGADGSGRLGERSAVLVALFGPAATKPVGAAATAAVHDGRWATVHLASAASDLLGPEQLERVLGLTGRDGQQRAVEGTASALAANLERVLAPYTRPRRLTLLLDLWAVVGSGFTEAARRRRLVEIQGGPDRLADVRERYARQLDEWVIDLAGQELGQPVRPTDLARWHLGSWQWHWWLERAAQDAIAATVLVRAAVAVAEHGLTAGLAEVRPQLALAPLLLTKREKIGAGRRMAGLEGIPGRPGVYLRELDGRLQPRVPRNERTEAFVRQRLARAREIGVVTLEAVDDLLRAILRSDAAGLDGVSGSGRLRDWREAVGYSGVRPPEQWQQPVLRGTGRPLGERLAEASGVGAYEVEHLTDLLWCADLADALAQLNGHPAAAIEYGQELPIVDTDPPPAVPEPLRPSEDSLALAVAGAGQLVDLGAELPARPGGWRELVDSLLAATVVAEALTGSFAVPPALRSRDGITIPGTEATLEVAYDPHQLAAWARFMGNCIAGSHYLRAATRGRSVLLALRDPAGRILSNVELCPTRGGWEIGEFRARFNADPEPELEQRLREWVATLPPNPTERRTTVARPRGPGGVHRPRRQARVLGEVREALAARATEAYAAPEVVTALATLEGLGLGAVRAVYRSTGPAIEEAVARALASRSTDLLTLWRATGVRPMASAVAGLDPALRGRHAYLDLLLGDGPLPAVPRRLARVSGITEARTLELVARRLRRAIGRLATGPVLAPLVPRRADTALLCALILRIASAAPGPASGLIQLTRAGDVAVPGYPKSTLDDDGGPWRRATADATDLGAVLDWPATALWVPQAWLGRGGWPALWAGVNRRS